MINVIKKNGMKELFNEDKIVTACNKATERAVCRKLTLNEQLDIISSIKTRIAELKLTDIEVPTMHALVEHALDEVIPEACEEYKKYRNWKNDYAKDYEDINNEIDEMSYRGDKSNANTDSALVSTKKSLGYNILNKKRYQRFFMTKEELQACKDGYIYVHDMCARLDSANCCIFDIEEVITGGFEMGNIFYEEPHSLKVAFDVIGDIVLGTASQQYGGFTLPEIDKVLRPYAEKSWDFYYDEYLKIAGEEDSHLHVSYDAMQRRKKRAEAYADKKVQRDFEQGFQGWEMKFNTVASSRGDYPFVTITSGLDTTKFGVMSNIAMFKVRAEGQGMDGHKKPVLFPKIVFLYDENIHTDGNPVFEAALSCSQKAMYPDYLSLTGEGYVADMYKKYGEVISPMGCRAFLSPYWKKGGLKQLDETDTPVFVGRFNMGVVSLNLPMILAKAREEGKDFYEVLDHFLMMIRKLHLRTRDYLGELKASTNPVAFCEGGYYKGHLKPDDKIRPILDACTASFGITALNELQMLYNGKSLVEDGDFALEVMQYINKKITEYKEEDHLLYAIYGTPAESLCGLQVKQFRAKFGIIKGVSDRPYVSNSFHCHVTEDITPIQKQDLERRFWNLFNGGKIQYVRYPISYNREAIRTLVKRAMEFGYYEGVNLSLAYCDDCGHQELEMDVCPVCGSKNLTKIDRMNGYLSYSRVKGDTRLNESKMAEIAERKSM